MSENNTYQYKLIRDIPLFINPDNPEDVSKKLDSDGEFLNYLPNSKKTYRAKTSEIITKLQIDSLTTDNKTTAGAINELKTNISNITGNVDIEQLAGKVTTLEGKINPLEDNISELQNTVDKIDTDAIEELQDIIEYQETEVKIKESKIPDVYVKYESSTIGNTTTPVYIENGQATTGSQYVAKSGGTFTGSVVFDKTITSNGNINAYGGTLVAGKATGEPGTIRIYNQVTKDGEQRAYASIQVRKPTTDGNNVYYIDKSGAGSFVFKTNANGTAVGSATKPIYITGDGTATASSSTVGSSTKPIYMKSGTLTASSDTVGSSTQPVYLNGGTITALSYSFNQNLNKSDSPTFKTPLVTAIKSSNTTDGNISIYTNSSSKGQVYLRGKYVNCVNYGNTAYTTLRAANVSSSSSRRVKENIQSLSEEQAKKLLDVNVVSFDYKKEVGGRKNQRGVIAEEVVSLIPSVVDIPQGYDENSNDLRNVPGVDYSKFAPYLIKMVQIQQQQINSLQERIQTLQNKNN